MATPAPPSSPGARRPRGALDDLVTLLTDDELRALVARVHDELMQRHGPGRPAASLVDALTSDEAQVLGVFRTLAPPEQQDICAHLTHLARKA